MTHRNTSDFIQNRTTTMTVVYLPFLDIFSFFIFGTDCEYVVLNL